jgi:hypothetical protein
VFDPVLERVLKLRGVLRRGILALGLVEMGFVAARHRANHLETGSGPGRCEPDHLPELFHLRLANPIRHNRQEPSQNIFSSSHSLVTLEIEQCFEVVADDPAREECSSFMILFDRGFRLFS